MYDVHYFYELIGAYLLAPVTYPLYAFYYWGRELYVALPWLFIGVGGIFAVRQVAPFFLAPFIAVWFLPGTIICGDAAAAPWILTVPYAFSEGKCATLLGLMIYLILNLVIAYSMMTGVRVFTHKRNSA